MVAPFYEKSDAEGALALLVKEAAERWTKEQGMVDDITIVMVFLNIQDQEKSA